MTKKSKSATQETNYIKAKETKFHTGFTLLETLLSLALTALLVGMMVTMTRQWILNWDLGANKIDQIETVTLAENRIARDLQSSIFLASGPNRVPSFDGDTDHIIIVREPSSTDVTVHLQAITYYNDPDRGVIRSTKIYNGITPLNKLKFNEKIVLLPANYHLDLTFQTEDDSPAFRAADGGLPTEVEFTISLSGGRKLSTRKVKILAELPPSCISAKTFKNCKDIIEINKTPGPTDTSLEKTEPSLSSKKAP